MANWQEYYSRYLNMEMNDRISLAKDYANALIKAFTKSLGKARGNMLFLELYSTAVCADNKVSTKEYELYKTLTNTKLSFDDFYNNVTNIIKNKGIISLIDGIIDDIGEISFDAKLNIVNFITIICAINGVITINEQKLIERYYN